MLPCLVEVRYVQAHTLWLRFADGAEGEVGLANELEGEIFAPLKDPDTFRSFPLHRELRTIVWPNRADFAPEFLRAALRVAA